MSTVMPNTGGVGGETPKHTPILCEFCESKLTRRGQVLDLSEKARVLRRQQDTIESQKHTIDSQAAEITRLTSELAAARAAAPPDGPEDDEDDDFFK